MVCLGQGGNGMVGTHFNVGGSVASHEPALEFGFIQVGSQEGLR